LIAAHTMAALIAISPVPAIADATSTWTGIVTVPDEFGQHLTVASGSTATPNATVTVDTSFQGQTWLGVGAAATDASVKFLRENPSLVDLLFDPTSPGGARLNLIRLPLSATDFSYDSNAIADPVASRPNWFWDNPDTPPIEQQRAVSLVRAAQQRNAGLIVVGTPWSAPPSFKTTGVLNGGDLKPGAEQTYGKFLAGQVRTLLAQGVQLKALTVGNEPGHNSANYPVMGLTDPQVGAIASSVKENLQGANVALWALDHNWDDWDHANAEIAGSPGTFARAAFHCYGGDPKNMALAVLRSVVTECTGTNDSWAGTFDFSEKLIVDAVDAGSTGLLLWNMVLDANNGPHSGGCGNCRGLVNLTRLGQPTTGPEFYELAHLARAAQPQAVRVRAAVSSPNGSVRAVAFQNLDGSVGVFGHNHSQFSQVIAVAGSGPAGQFTVPGGAIFTFLSAPGQPRGATSTIRPYTVIRVPATGASWYVDADLTKHWIRDGETYLCLMERRVPLQDGLTQSVADSLRDGPWQPQCLAPSRFEDKILQGPDNFSYYVDGGVRHWIPNGGTFLCLKTWKAHPVTDPLTWEQVNSIGEDTNVHASCTPDEARGKVIRESQHGTTWYVDESLRKHWIRDGETYFCMAAHYPLLDGLTQEHADALEDGDWVAPCLDSARFEGAIARARDKPAPRPSYAIYGGKRHWIPDSWTYSYLIAHGFRVIDVATEDQIKSIPDGGTEPAKLDPASVPRNTIVRRDDGVSWIVDGSGIRHHIPYAQDDVCWRDLRGYTVSATKLTWSQANELPETDAWPCIIGDRIVKSSDGASYVVDTSNVRHWIPDPETYGVLSKSYDGRIVGPWPAADVAQIPNGDWAPYRIDPASALNTIICRTSDKHCWAVDGSGTRHFIPSYADDICWRWVNGWRVSRPALNDQQAASLGEGAPWGCSLNGRILATNEGASYYIDGDTRRWIQDAESFNCYVARGAPVIRGIGMAEVTGLREGAWMPWCLDASAYRNHIVNWNGDTSQQKTAWVASSELKRYWIPDAGTYNCLKGTGFGGPDSLSSQALDQLTDQRGFNVTCGGDWLGTNRVLLRNTYIRSNDGRYVLWLQGDGNLVMYGPQGVVWANGRVSDILIMQADGNLVTYAFGGGATWSTGSGGSGANTLVVQNDGHLVLWAPGRVVWSR
jgi:O-glycosyl hydrolase